MPLIGLALRPTILNPLNYLHVAHTWERAFKTRLQLGYSNARVIVFGVDASAIHFKHISHIYCVIQLGPIDTRKPDAKACGCEQSGFRRGASPDYGRLEAFDTSKIICNGTERYVRLKDAFQRKPL